MSDVKERLIGAITIMNEASAMRLWEIVRSFSDEAWEQIPEEEPDEFDLQMIQDAATDPDCGAFD